MNPIHIASQAIIPLSPEEICAEFADLSRWPEFDGYGPLPGIKMAEYEERTADMVGSRIRVENRDGSTHVESIKVWDVGRQVVMELGEFSPPLSHLATHFVEEWSFQVQEQRTLVTRRFQLYPRSSLTRPPLWLIGRFFRRAIDQHLADMAQTARSR